MGALVQVSVLCLNLLLVVGNPLSVEEGTTRSVRQVAPNFYSNGLYQQIKGILSENPEHSASPGISKLQASSTNFQPLNVRSYQFNADDAVVDHYNKPIDQYNNGYGVVSQYGVAPYREFSSIEEDTERYNDADFQNEAQFLDTTGFKHYKTQTSFNLEGPKQLETITTKSYHKEVEPYDISGFKKEHHEAEEDHAEVHYHQHKHLHKHSHKQEHVHKHKDEHKHEHGHKHSHQGHHDHKHIGEHKHQHQGQHQHQHKGVHQHKHSQEHKHSHHGTHHHDHKHHQEHKHDHHHGHKHSHHSDHKHSHHNEHKHDHHHGHTHHSDHQHKHSHHGSHKHSHSHKGHHSHSHKGEHHHSHKHSSKKHY